jgi:hypothetical protein
MSADAIMELMFAGVETATPTLGYQAFLEQMFAELRTADDNGTEFRQEIEQSVATNNIGIQQLTLVNAFLYTGPERVGMVHWRTNRSERWHSPNRDRPQS